MEIIYKRAYSYTAAETRTNNLDVFYSGHCPFSKREV
jgi:hypothetical protein